LTRKLDGGQVLEKPKKNQNQNKMDETHENHYGMDCIGYRPLCPFWKFWLGQIRHGHRKFQSLRLIYGATSMLLTKKLDGGQVSRNPRKTQTQIFEENRENNENHYVMECGGYKPLVPIFLCVWKFWLALNPHKHLTSHKEQCPVPSTFNNTTTNPPLQNTNRVAR